MITHLRRASVKRIAGTAVLRLDFNTKDTWRMEASLPTVEFLLHHAAKVVIISHRGRPKGVRMQKGVPSGFEKSLSLRADAKSLQSLIKRPVTFIPHFRFDEIRTEIALAPRGSVFMLENLRFVKDEEENSDAFARDLASLGDYYVNDAFAVSHRANASVVAITRHLPRYAGFELEKEITHLGMLARHPKRPLVMIFGGAKAGDKLPVMHYFRKKTDCFILSGALSNTVLRAKGIGVGKSLTDEHPLPIINEIIGYPNLVLPIDYQVRNDKILDIGPKTIKYFGEKIRSARTIIWNGPLGMIEKKPFDKGTLGVAKLVAKNKRAFSVLGGGETIMFLKRHKLDKHIKLISTGGGAMLDFLAGKKLPGIEALKK